jgi:hypothetical protein
MDPHQESAGGYLERLQGKEGEEDCFEGHCDTKTPPPNWVFQ